MLRAIAILLACMGAITFPKPAKASYDRHGYTQSAVQPDQHRGSRHHRQVRHRNGSHRVSVAHAVHAVDPQPRAWCGYWLRHQLGVADRKYNLARAWAGYGSPASGPAPGVIAVWRHHVGLITGVPGHGRIVLRSGNDGHRVRERERSTRGVIAYRWPAARVASRN